LAKIMGRVAEISIFFPEARFTFCAHVAEPDPARDSVRHPLQGTLIEIYRNWRPATRRQLDTATSLFHGMFFSSDIAQV